MVKINREQRGSDAGSSQKTAVKGLARFKSLRQQLLEEHAGRYVAINIDDPRQRPIVRETQLEAMQAFTEAFGDAPGYCSLIS